MVEHVATDGPFQRAGIKSGDIIPEVKNVGSFLARLRKARGSTLTVAVVPGGNGLPLNERPVRQVVIAVPKQTRSKVVQ